jgi:hypothetical protein
MMRALAVVIALGACTKAGPSEPTTQPPTTGIAPVTTTPPPTTPPATVGKITVVMTAATLADDCGGSAPWEAPQAKAATKKQDSEFADMDEPKGKAKMARRRCEQTSMQLSVTAAAGGAPAKVQVKKVELFDQNGKSLGVLAASKPTRWTDKSMYEAWDESVAPDQKLSVSYVLAQPNWDAVPDRMNKTYTVKATVSVGGGDQTVSKDVELRAPTILPPGVKT